MSLFNVFGIGAVIPVSGIIGLCAVIILSPIFFLLVTFVHEAGQMIRGSKKVHLLHILLTRLRVMRYVRSRALIQTEIGMENGYLELSRRDVCEKYGRKQ